MKKTGIDDHLAKAGTTAESLEALSRKDLLSVQGAMIPLDGLTESPALDLVEARLRVIRASLDGQADALHRETVCIAVIARLKELKVPGAPDLVRAAFARAGGQDGQGKVVAFTEPEPWSEPVDGAALLEELDFAFRRLVILPDGGPEALSLWVVFTHALDAFEVAPIVALSSPVLRCGKTTTLGILSGLVRRPLPASNVSAAALFRAVEKFKPTLIVDEADTFLLENEELRGVINSGHSRQTAYVLRTVGDEHEPRLFSTWGARAIALIGRLPGTLEDRAIVLAMRRKAATETVAHVRWSRLAAALEPSRRRAARWAADSLATLQEADPAIPDGLDDRQADNWRPLLAIADLAGGAWPERARKAACVLAGGRAEDPGLALQLLADIREVLAEGKDKDKIPSAELVARLVALDDHPWGECNRGKAITQNGLARLLKPFGVKPHGIRIGGDTPKGYEQKDFADPFSRYLGGFNPQQPQQVNDDTAIDVKTNPQHDPSVADGELALTTRPDGDVAAVAVQNPRETGQRAYDL